MMRRGLSMTACMAALAACSAPDISPSLSASQALLDATIADLDPVLAPAMAAELRVAETQAAAAGRVIVDLPPSCLGNLGNIERALGDCRVLSRASPLDADVSNATQVDFALQALRDYFIALTDLVTATAPNEIRANTSALLSAVSALSAEDGSPLADLSARAQAIQPAASATAGFIANQMRLRAIRRVMTQADPVIFELVLLMQPELIALGDPAERARSRVIDAYEAYQAARSTSDVPTQVAAAAALRAAMDAAHRAEAASPLRRLYLLANMHSSTLDRLRSGGDLQDFERFVVEATDILQLWEAANAQ